jgi:hypothetical protein
MFAEREQQEIELRLTSTLNLHEDLTLQLSAQLLDSMARHQSFAELIETTRGSWELVSSTQTLEADYAVTFFPLYSALRWDLGNGGAVLLVYRLEAQGRRVTGRPLDGSIHDLFDEPAVHTVLMKVSYGWR